MRFLPSRTACRLVPVGAYYEQSQSHEIGVLTVASAEKSVFISYRRTNAFTALAVYQDLSKHGYDVFFDYNSIDSGDFEQVILNNILSRAHFLVILTPSALERCGEPGDWLRREIETALDSKRNIVPLMFEGFSFGDDSISKHLTGKLALLKQYNAQRVPADFFEEAMAKIRNRFLNTSLDAVIHPRNPAAQQAASRAQTNASAQPQVQEEALTAQEWFEKAMSSPDLDAKIRIYSEAIRLKPDYAHAFNNRGAAYGDQGDLAGAIADYDQAIRLDPDFAAAYNNRGLVRYNQGDLVGAIADYDQAIRLDPDFAAAYNKRGGARQSQGNLAGAIADYDQAIRLKPDFALAHYNRGNAHAAKGDLAAAIADYDQAIRLKPDFASAYNNRGNAYYMQGNKQKAKADWETALRYDPNNQLTRKNLGIVKRELGE